MGALAGAWLGGLDPAGGSVGAAVGEWWRARGGWPAGGCGSAGAWVGEKAGTGREGSGEFLSGRTTTASFCPFSERPGVRLMKKR